MTKQRLQQKQQQNLSPLQIQFLGLLQVPIESLEKQIEKELEENPALEEATESEDVILSSPNIVRSHTSEDFSKMQIEDKQESFSDYLHQQLIDLNINEDQKFLISYLINSLDDLGFLNRKLPAISSDLLVSHELIIKKDDLLSALATLQTLDPIGVGAKNLQECLLIQLKTFFPENEIAFTIINDFYTAFSNKNFEYLIKKLEINTQELKEIYLLIESLNPIPSNGFSKENTTTEYITADFIINIKNNKLELILNKNNKPLQISKYYSDLLEKTTDEETVSFLKEKIEKAKWFRASLIKREDTLKKVMTAILNIQERFFLDGNEKSLAPMRLVDVAEIVSMDISTISRVSNSKYVEAPFGTFKLKDLFSEAYRKDNGEIISTKEIKKRLKEIVEAENKSQPYTDEELAELLGEDEYHIARRTVSKYRENLNIQTAKLRRELG